MSLKCATFPTIEKIARVVPKCKTENRSFMNNYRPISILPICSKLIESLVHQQLYEYLEKHELLTQSQFGFRKNRNTQQAVTVLTGHIRLNMKVNVLAFDTSWPCLSHQQTSVIWHRRYRAKMVWKLPFQP